LYYNGIGTPEDKATALNIYKRGAENGSSISQYLLGKYYIEDLNNFKDGLAWLLKSADKKEYLAALYIAQLYSEGKYVAKDDYYALEYYHMAAQLGSTEAAFYIAEKMLSSGDSSKYAKGLEYLKYAADNKNMQACNTLAKLYITENNFVPVDPKQHIIYTSCAANNGDLTAIRTIADYYTRGYIVSIDNTQAAKYFDMYINLSGTAPTTQDDINLFFEAGLSQYSANNIKKSVNYLKIAAKAGHPEAANTLARMYENGNGVKVDLDEALNYYQIAQKNGLDTSESIARIQSIKG
jgi:TPR repeat protein